MLPSGYARPLQASTYASYCPLSARSSDVENSVDWIFTSKPASPAIACTTCARRYASEVVGVMSVMLGWGTPACASSAFARARSRLGTGMLFTYQPLVGATHWLPAS